MNKTELITAIAAETDLSKTDVSRALDSVLENLSQVSSAQPAFSRC